LSDVAVSVSANQSSSWNSEVMNLICQEYLNERKQAGIQLNNEDVFYLIRYALSGNPVGAPIGEIAEVVGKDSTLQRMQKAASIFLEKSK